MHVLIRIITVCLGFWLASFSIADSVVIKTNKGDIKVELLDDKSPLSVANFLAYVDAGFYNGVIFHRVIDGFMIQTGGHNEDLSAKPTRPAIVNESNNYVRNDRGTLAMARTSNPNSATAQFFINLQNNRSLNYRFGQPGYAVFGQVIEGMDVVDRIARVETTSLEGFENLPVEAVIIESVKRVSSQP